MAAFTASQASVTNGSKIVTINSGESIANIRQGDFLFLAGFLVEINRGYVGGSSQQYIELVKNWANSNQSNQPAVVIPTTGDFRAAVDAINNANKNVNDNFVAMNAWQTNMGTVTFVNQDGTTTTVKTLKQIEADNAAQMEAYHPYPWAMRKVEFEARRAANKEKYAASGFVHLGKHSDTIATPPINEGMFTRSDGQFSQGWHANKLWLGRNDSYASGSSKENSPTITIAGALTKIYGSSGTQDPFDGASFVVKFPPAEDGTRTYDSATGASVKHATPAIAFASETATNEVVTDRVDMWGFEAFLREINDADPFVYKHGLIQSSATNINGIPTVEDNVRPITYFAWYEGDTTSRGKGVNWQTASESQRIVIASDPENNIYFDDSTGKFYQWSPRGRSFAGVGNGDWASLATTNHYLGFDSKSRVAVQGILSSSANLTASASASYNSGANLETHGVVDQGFGVFSNKSPAFSNSRECYFLGCGTVNRLNQGAYHPSLNPLGTDQWIEQGVVAGSWNLSDSFGISRVQCFTRAISIGEIGKRGKGAIGLESGRPDGRFYDAIYASGASGVCRDMRYSAWGLKQEDFAAADLAIKSGEYRGRETLLMTKIYEVGTITGSATSGTLIGYSYFSHFLAENGGLLGEHEYYMVLNKVTGEVFDSRRLPQIFTTGGATSHLYWPSSWGGVPELIAVRSYNTNLSVAGQYTHTEVIGDPASILLCDDLKDGWVGSWNPNIPDGVKDLFPFSRPYQGSGTDITRIFTVDSGVTWSNGVITLSDPTVNATQYSNMPANQVTIYQYKTKAKCVTGTSNYQVFGDVGDVFASSFYAPTWGRNFAYSAIGKILSNTLGSGHINRNFKILDYSLRPITGVLDHTTYREPTHHPLTILGANNDVGFKALNYNVADNQQGFINYAYTELKHDGTDWGDDSKIHIADNQTTMLDENGNTVLVGTARCVEPLGWIKNDK